MRNLKEHPITVDEKLAALKSAVELIQAQGKLGDVRATALKAIAREISDAEITRIMSEDTDDGDELPFPTIEEAQARLKRFAERRRAFYKSDAFKRSLEIADKLEGEAQLADGLITLKAKWMQD
jgi:hypothetical protein